MNDYEEVKIYLNEWQEQKIKKRLNSSVFVNFQGANDTVMIPNVGIVSCDVEHRGKYRGWYHAEVRCSCIDWYLDVESK